MKIANELECPECLGSGIYTCLITGGSDLCENCGGTGKITPTPPQPGVGGEAEDKPTNVSEEVYQRAQQGLDAAHERISATPPIALPVRAEARETALEQFERLRRECGENEWHSVAYSMQERATELEEAAAALSRELEEAKAEAARAKAVNADLKAQRDAACRESARRDQKWMAGIQEECGTEINFDPLTNAKTHVPTLGQFIKSLRAAPRPEGAIESAIQRFEDKERGIPQAHMAAELVKELRTALAALAPRSETEGRDKALLDELERLASETECGVQVCCDNLTDPKKPAWWLEVEGQIVPVHLKEYAGNLRDAIAAALAHDEKGAGERQDQTYKELKDAARRMGEASRAGEIE